MRSPLLAAAALLGQALVLAIALSHASPASGDDDDRGRGLAVIGLTADQRLIAFRSQRPSRAREIGAITNLSGDARIVGIDFRPATGDLYGLGNAGGVYTLDLETAEATFQAQLGTALQGTAFGVDFNPTVDRLRVVSDTGQSLRIDVTTGATTSDAGLNVGSPPAPALGVTGVAYTNNDADPGTATTLFDIDTDSATDALFIQAPPNAGSLNLTGNLGVDAVGDVGCDIFSRLRGGTTWEVVALAAITTDRSRLYRINLFTGRASLLGRFGRDDEVIGLAIALDRHGAGDEDDD
jgi:hypothetical protein